MSSSSDPSDKKTQKTTSFSDSVSNGDHLKQLKDDALLIVLINTSICDASSTMSCCKTLKRRFATFNQYVVLALRRKHCEKKYIVRHCIKTRVEQYDHWCSDNRPRTFDLDEPLVLSDQQLYGSFLLSKAQSVVESIQNLDHNIYSSNWDLEFSQWQPLAWNGSVIENYLLDEEDRTSGNGVQLSLDTNGIQGWGRCADGERLKGQFVEKLFIEVTKTKPLSKETSIDLSGWMNVFVPDGENQVNDFNNGEGDFDY